MARPYRPSAKPLSDFVDGCLSPTLQAQGFAASDIILSWPDIVGPHLAGFCEPLKLQWPRKKSGDTPQEPATLHIRVEGAFGLELQHMAPILIERINARFGWRCVGRISMKQGPLQRAPSRKRPSLTLTPEAQTRACEAATPIEDENLRAALTRLGAAVLTVSQRAK